MDGETDTRYRTELEAHGLSDVQTLYRALLRRLKGADPAAYDRAVAHYEERLLPALEAGDEDPLRLWIDYGIWVAAQLRPGRLVAIDESGLATSLAEEGGEAPPLDRLLLQLPDDPKQGGLALAVPSRPSAAQQTTLELLCG